LSEAADALAGAAPGFRYAASRAPAKLADGVARAGADVLHALAGLLEEGAGAAADALHGLTHAREQLRVAVEGEHDALEDRRDVVEPRLHQRLRLHALDVELHFAQARLRAHAELDHPGHLRH